jgi:hypothetical protein
MARVETKTLVKSGKSIVVNAHEVDRYVAEGYKREALPKDPDNQPADDDAEEEQTVDFSASVEASGEAAT